MHQTAFLVKVVYEGLFLVCDDKVWLNNLLAPAISVAVFGSSLWNHSPANAFLDNPFYLLDRVFKEKGGLLGHLEIGDHA